jgi:hypothetical protein
MSKLEDKAVYIMDKAMVGAEKLTEKLAELAVQYGPDVVNAAIEVARIEALSGLVRPLVALGICLPLFIISVKRAAVSITKQNRWDELRDSHTYPVLEGGKHATKTLGYGPQNVAVLLWCATASATGTISCFAAYGLSSVWNWVGVIEPKLWIAHRILEKAL